MSSMEKMPHDFNFIGKDLETKGVKESAEKSITEDIQNNREAFKNKEKSPLFKKMIKVGQDILKKEFGNLGVDTQYIIDEEGIDIKEKAEMRKPGFYNTHYQSIWIQDVPDKTIQEKIIDKVHSFFDKPGTAGFRHERFHQLLHEMVHASGHVKYHADIEEKKVKTYRSGYLNISQNDQELMFLKFNEGVVERATMELMKKYDEEITEKLDIAPAEKKYLQRFSAGNYRAEVGMINSVTNAIAQHKNISEEEVWEDFKKGHFTGNMMHLRAIDEVYGEGTLRIIASLENIIQKKSEKTGRSEKIIIESKLFNFLRESDLEERKKLREELLDLIKD
jgi:hypothetical protein